MNILPIYFGFVLTFYLFLFFFAVVPFFLKKKHIWRCAVVTFSTSLALAIISQSEFDFHERLVKGTLFGATAFILGWLVDFLKRRQSKAGSPQ